MLTYSYKIVMQTPLGPRKGSLYLEISENKVTGYLGLLGNRNSFSGKIDRKGCCKIHGQIITLMRTIEYTGTGHADENSVELTLQGVRDIFYLKGTAYLISKGEHT